MTQVANGSIRVLVCEDHPVLADALGMLIEGHPELELAADPVDTAERAVAAVSQHLPDVVLMDVQLAGPMNGVEATRIIRQTRPATKVVVMSGATEPDQLLVDALEAGASGFFAKTEAASTMLAAVRAAASGEILVDADTLARVMREVAARRAGRGELDQRTAKLTVRERQILQLLAEGMSNDHVAATCHLSAATVQTHLRNVFAKMGVHSKLEAVTLGVKAGVVHVPGQRAP